MIWEGNHYFWKHPYHNAQWFREAFFREGCVKGQKVQLFNHMVGNTCYFGWLWRGLSKSYWWVHIACNITLYFFIYSGDFVPLGYTKMTVTQQSKQYLEALKVGMTWRISCRDRFLARTCLPQWKKNGRFLHCAGDFLPPLWSLTAPENKRLEPENAPRKEKESSIDTNHH